MRGQGAKRVNLFRHAHRADFGGHRRADAAGDHQRRQHRAEFAAHRNAHDRERGRVHFDLVKLEISLCGQHHAGERAGDEHHRLRFHADEINLMEHIAPRASALEQRRNRFPGQQSDLAQLGERCVHAFTGRKTEHQGQSIKSAGFGQCEIDVHCRLRCGGKTANFNRCDSRCEDGFLKLRSFFWCCCCCWRWRRCFSTNIFVRGQRAGEG